MLSLRFKVFVIIFTGLQLAACNFDEFIDSDDINEDFNKSYNDANRNLTAAANTNRTGGIFHGTFNKHVWNFLPHSESTTPDPLNSNNPEQSASFKPIQVASGRPPHGSLLSQSFNAVIRLPYEGVRTAKDLLVSRDSSHAGSLWNHTKEHGNMERLGREFVKKVVDAFGRSDTQGLDTNATFFGGVMDKFKEYVRFIYPGTIWCGEGDIAGKSTDLGMFTEPDKCCRAHDKCHNYIEKGATKYGLENTGMFTRSHCSCDNDFHDCLRDSKSAVGLQIGITYFTVLGPQCFEETQKIDGCDKTFMGRCVKYIFNESNEKKYQWFDNPTF